MCLTCGCLNGSIDHGVAAKLTLSHLRAAANADHISPREAAHNLVATLKHEGFIDDKDDELDALTNQQEESSAVPSEPGPGGESIHNEGTTADRRLLQQYTGRAHPGSVGRGSTKMSSTFMSAFHKSAEKFQRKQEKA